MPTKLYCNTGIHFFAVLDFLAKKNYTKERVLSALPGNKIAKYDDFCNTKVCSVLKEATFLRGRLLFVSPANHAY